MLAEQTPEGQRWLWTTARDPQSTHDYGYAASREQAIADFKVRWAVISSPNTSNSSFRVSTSPINGQDAMNLVDEHRRPIHPSSVSSAQEAEDRCYRSRLMIKHGSDFGETAAIS